MLKDFYYDYFRINLRDYGFGVDLEISKALLIVILGVCIAIVMINFNKAQLFTLIKQLIRHEAYSEEDAKSLKGLGLYDNRFIKYSLSRDGQFTRIVRRVGEVKPTYEEYVNAEKEKKARKKQLREARRMALAEYDAAVKEAKLQGLTPPEKPTFEGVTEKIEGIDFKTALFYIPEEARDRAKHLYENNNATLLKTVLAVVFLLISYFILVMLMPDILNLLSRLFVG